jgi:hypothetical protein
MASIRNMVGFGATVWATAYLAVELGLRKPALLIAAIVVLIMLTTLNALVMFTIYTIRSIPATMASKTPDITFKDIYAYTLTGIAIRLVEISAYICYIIYLYKIFF